jgi:hypothetical protein
MTDVETDRGFTGLVWHPTRLREQYEAYHAGCRYLVTSYSRDCDYSEWGIMYSLAVYLPDGQQIHRIYKGLGTAKGCATKLAQRLQWRFRGEYWDRVIAEREQEGHHA